MSSMFPYIHIPIYKLSANFVIEAFGLLVAIGVIYGAILARRRAEMLRLDVNLLIDSFFFVVPGGFVIAHWVTLFLYFPERIAKDPLQIIYFWAGISSFGGILGGLLVASLFFHFRRVPVRPYLDVLAWGLIPGFTIGRIGCTVAHDHAGMWMVHEPLQPMLIATGRSGDLYLPGWQSPQLWLFIVIFALTVALIVSLVRERPFWSQTTLVTFSLTAVLLVLVYPVLPDLIRSLAIPWPISKNFTADPNKIPMMLLWGDQSILIQGKTALIQTRLTYDLGLIELLFYLFLICGLAVLVAGKPRMDGSILTIWFLTYSPVRFLLDYLRIWDRRYWGLTPGQYLCIAMFLVGVYLYATMPKQRWGDYAPAGKSPKPGPSQPLPATST